MNHQKYILDKSKSYFAVFSASHAVRMDRVLDLHRFILHSGQICQCSSSHYVRHQRMYQGSRQSTPWISR